MDAYAEVSGDRIVWLGILTPTFLRKLQVYTWTPTEGVTHLSTSSTLNQWPMVSGDRVVWFGAGGTDAGGDNEVFTWTSYRWPGADNYRRSGPAGRAGLG